MPLYLFLSLLSQDSCPFSCPAGTQAKPCPVQLQRRRRSALAGTGGEHSAGLCSWAARCEGLAHFSLGWS